MARKGIITAGHWIVDINKTISHWPEPQTLAMILNVVKTNGGAAFNVACDLARLAPGLPLTAMGLIGEDEAGDYVVETCTGLGVDVRQLRRTSAALTSFTEVMSEKETGRRTFFHLPGATSALDASHFDFTGCNERIFFLAYLGLLESLDRLDANGRNDASRVLERAKESGLMTATDLVSAPNDALKAQILPCLPHLDLLFANEWEAARVVGKPLPADAVVSADEAIELASRIRSLGLAGSIVVHFPGGAVAVSASGESFRQGSVNVPKTDIVGTTGAGDAFAAGVLLGLHEDMDLKRALELGVCSAAVSLHHVTCSESIVPWRECLEYGNQHGFRSL
jgi:sugar/nucleoside kinase (ribokinase family)